MAESTDLSEPAVVEHPSLPAQKRPPGRTWLHSRPALLGLLSLIVLVACWQLVVALKLVKAIFLPTPLQVLSALGTLFTSGDLWSNLSVSAQEFILGLVISVLIGAVLGILTGWYKRLDELLKPIVVGLNALPQVAVLPVLILIFGIGMAPKVVVVILSCTTTILMNMATGVATVEEHLMRLSRSFGASDAQAIRTVVIPHVVPYFMSGLRISIGRAMIGVVVGEIFASKAGIGSLLISASNNFNMSVAYATIIVLTVLGIALTQGAAWLERRMQSWRA